MQGCFSFLRSLAPKAERTVTPHPAVPFLNKATKVRTRAGAVGPPSITL